MSQRTEEDLRRSIERRTQAGTDGCLIWTGAVDSDGYPKVGIGKTPKGHTKLRPAHRINWELTIGPIPPGFILARADCENRRCIAPAHLALLKGKSRAAVIASMSARGLTITDGKFSCGHPKTAENIIQRIDRSWQRCKTCARAQAKARYAEQQLTPEAKADLRARQRAYYHRNRDRINATNRARAARNRPNARKADLAA